MASTWAGWAHAGRSATGSSSRARSRAGPLRAAEQATPPRVDEQSALVALAERIQLLLILRGATLATAESCTGGLVGHLLTEVPGSSGYYVGGLISYSNSLKESELGVPRDTLARHGAVSAQVAVAMAEGARSRYRASLGVAVTGIAGPDGGTPQKPVGLTYIAIADDAGHDVRRHQWTGDRAHNKLASARACLELVFERASTGTAAASADGAPPEEA